MYDYLKFLEKTRFIKNREQAIMASLEFYKKLNMEQWLPNIYRVGGSRAVLMRTSYLNEIFQLLSDTELLGIGRKIALRAKEEDSIYEDLDTRLVENWPIVINDLENLGWGKFELFGKEIRIEQGTMPIQFLLGFFDGMFETPFRPHYTRVNIVVLIPSLKRDDPPIP
jgi:hypothetical protein